MDELSLDEVKRDVGRGEPDARALVALRPEHPRARKAITGAGSGRSSRRRSCSVIANVVQNGLEAHEGKGGRVVVRAAVEGRSAVVRVLDEGKGLTPEVQARLFEPFFTTKPEAIGLGLVIAREIVEAHGGRIEARSRRDRSGAEVVVELRLDAETSP